jgi:hypothetical protein
MATAHFISKTYLVEHSPLSGNIDIKEIYPFARTAEEIYIQEAIGTKLFDRLIESLNASPKNTTANETILLKKIRSALLWFTCYDALPFLDIKVRAVGIVRQGGDNLQSVNREDISYLRKECKNKADFYLTMVQKYLCENSSLFSEYRGGNWGCSELFPNTNVSNSSDLAIDKNDGDDIDTDFARKWLND